MNWQQLTDTLSTDAHLKALAPEAVDAVVTVLAVVMYADERVSTLEKEEFRDLVDRLPFYGDKHATAEQIDAVIAQVTDVHGEAGFKQVIDSVAVVLTEADVRAATFRMAATLAYADLDMHANESAVLGWMAAAFNLDAAIVEQTYAEVG